MHLKSPSAQDYEAVTSVVNFGTNTRANSVGTLCANNTSSSKVLTSCVVLVYPICRSLLHQTLNLSDLEVT